MVVPELTPVAMPEVGFIVAIVGVELLHDPPDIEAERVDVFPVHNVREPLIVAVPAFIVISLVLKHPVIVLV